MKTYVKNKWPSCWRSLVVPCVLYTITQATSIFLQVFFFFTKPQTHDSWSAQSPDGRAGLLVFFTHTTHKNQTLHTLKLFTHSGSLCEMRTCGAHLQLRLLVLLAASTHCTENICDWNFYMRVSEWRLLENGSLQSIDEGALYPNGTFWKNPDGEEYLVCPCLSGNCVRICKEGICRIC